MILLPMVTQDNNILGTALSKVEGKGLFVKELERDILDNRADIAVYSIKDMSLYCPERLGLVTLCKKENSRDAFIYLRYHDVAQFPADSVEERPTEGGNVNYTKIIPGSLFEIYEVM